MAQKAGIATDDAKLKSLLASPELANIQVDDTIVTALDNGLLSLEAAKNDHPEIKKVYTAKAYNGMDAHLITLLGTDTFEAADLEEIKNEKSTSKKYELVIAKLKAQKATAKGADKDEINRQLTAAHDAARLAKEEVTTVKNQYEQKLKDIQLQAAIKAVFGNYKTIYDEQDPTIRSVMLEAIIKKGLQDKKAQFKTDEHGNLQLVSEDGSSNVFGENHVLLTPTSFFDKTLAPHLKVNGGPPKGPNAPTPRQPINVTPTKDEQNLEATVSQIKSHADKVIADMQAAPVGMV